MVFIIHTVHSGKGSASAAVNQIHCPILTVMWIILGIIMLQPAHNFFWRGVIQHHIMGIVLVAGIPIGLGMDCSYTGMDITDNNRSGNTGSAGAANLLSEWVHRHNGKGVAAI